MTAKLMTASDITTQAMVVGTFENHTEAERAVQRLIDAGVPADHISILTQGLEVREKVEGFVTTGDVARSTAGYGAWTGGLFGLIAGGVAFLWVPVLGPLVVLGPLAGAALGALEGGAMGGLLGAIMGKQMEKDHIPKIQAALQAGKFLVVVHGSPPELQTARRVMTENNGQGVSSYPAA
jgi:uncharacterized membrane protein